MRFPPQPAAARAVSCRWWPFRQRQGRLEIYGLNGTRIGRVTDNGGFFGNVDVRRKFPLGGQLIRRTRSADRVAACRGAPAAVRRLPTFLEWDDH